MTTTHLRPGDRVQIHPANDWWMKGARYGKVIRLSRSGLVATVALDKCNATTLIPTKDLEPID
jgi:hypothetical protein